jgi:hypothetical protein
METLNPEDLGLRTVDPEQTYLMHEGYVTAWIGSKWDVAEDSQGRFHVYRKGSWVLCVGTLGLALAIAVDDGGSPAI